MTPEPRLPFDDDDLSESPQLPGFERLSPGTRQNPSAQRGTGEPALGALDQAPGTAGWRPRTADLADADARRWAVNPAENVVLEASAGTGKTRVLVERYVNLLRAGVDPDNILAMTFTRKAAAEMRQRIVEGLREASRTSELDAAKWRDLRGRLDDIAISTIDAFCLALLREFPLEADVDPGFDLADETEVPRLTEEALDRSLRICRGLAKNDDDVALVFAQLGERRLRVGLGALLDRRLVAPGLLRRYLAVGPRDLTAAIACHRALERLRQIFGDVTGGLARFLDCGPRRHPQFAMLAADITRVFTLSTPTEGPGGGSVGKTVDDDLQSAALSGGSSVGKTVAETSVVGETSVGDGLQTVPGAHDLDTRRGQAAFRSFVDRLRAYFLTQEGKPRGERFSGTPFSAGDCNSAAEWKRHRDAAAALAPAVAEAIRGFRRDLNVVLSRGVRRMFAVTESEYRRALDARALVDFPGLLERAIDLLKQMDEFARSRYRLESRYQHVLVDEFQDTNRAQWELVAQLVRSWGEGLGASADAIPPSIFIVGDRKQSIYGFRDADVTLLDEAAQFIGQLRGQSGMRRSISVSFRSAPPLLAFVNDLFGAIASDGEDGPGPNFGFTYTDRDRFPIDDPVQLEPASPDQLGEIPVGLVVGDTVRSAAEAVADEIVGLLGAAIVRDKATGIPRGAVPADIAILFRSRESHREFESALEQRGVQTYVYKGLGFFEADEIQDAVAILRYLAEPTSNLRAAAFLRSRFVRLSDEAVMRLSPDLAAAIISDQPSDAVESLSAEDRGVLAALRASVTRWLAWVDRMTPAELLDTVLRETAYLVEIRGTRRLQARENLKKLRALIRRVQNRGYATLARIADHLERLAVGDESNAVIDAVDAVHLMTVHAAKGLEFPVVFVVNVGRGTGSVRPPIRVATSRDGRPAVSIADFQSEADAETESKEREETKRLLYVALTRARDRVYLSATVADGVCRAGRGSLAEVLPKPFLALFVEAARSNDRQSVLNWVPVAGHGHREHKLRALRSDSAGPSRQVPAPADSPTVARDDLDRQV